jgi:hypothetical protein
LVGIDRFHGNNAANLAKIEELNKKREIMS